MNSTKVLNSITNLNSRPLETQTPTTASPTCSSHISKTQIESALRFNMDFVTALQSHIKKSNGSYIDLWLVQYTTTQKYKVMSDFRKHLKQTIEALKLQPDDTPTPCMSSNSTPNTTTANPLTTPPTTP